MFRPLPFALIAGCVHPAPAAPPSGGGAVVYDVAVLTATGDRQVTALYALEVTPAGRRTWAIRTTQTAGTIEEGGVTWGFDSATPAAGDPWPLLLQHAVASVPASVRFDVTGAPESLVDADAWSTSARAAVEALGLPEQARAAGQQLLDPDGLLADLRRSFPGTPPAGPWTRPEHLAGIDAVRTETCALAEPGTWICEGTVEGPAEGPFHLHDATSSTTVVADDRGLVSHESAWSGTLLWLDGQEVRDEPVGGRRLVRRR